MIKNILPAVVISLALSGCSQAQTYPTLTFVRIHHVQPNYAVAYKSIPHTQCYNVNAPVHSYSNSGSGDVFTGMVMGGIVGNAIGKNSKSTALGAIIGGLIAAEPTSYVSGTRLERQCETVYVQQAQEIIDGYTVTYIHNNISGVVYTPFYFQPGELVSMNQFTTGR